MRTLIFLSIVFSVLGVGSNYIAWRIFAPWQFQKPIIRILWGALGFVLFLPITTVILSRYGFEGNLLDALSWIGLIAFGFFALVIVFLIAHDLLFGLFNVFRSTIFPRKVPIDEGRRRFLANSVNASILTASSAMAVYGFYEARKTPRVRRVEVPLGSKHPSLKGFRIAQVTDLHVGPTIHSGFVEKVVEQVNSTQPDLIALTGDLVDGSVSHLRKHTSLLKGLKSKYGVFYCTGNHEYYSGVGEWCEEFRSYGFEVLMNESRLIDHKGASIQVGGVTDYRVGGSIPGQDSSPRKAMGEGASSADLKLLLAHQPRSVFEAAEAGFDFQLSGHTHGGQFFPWNFAISFFQPYAVGLNQHQGTWIYVSPGTGYWGPPTRLGVPSEVSLIEMV